MQSAKRSTATSMWMFEVELSNGTLLQAYKHVDTSGYVHLDPHGAAFVYEPPDRYRPFPLADVLAAVFGGLPWLRGVTANRSAGRGRRSNG